MTSTMVLNAWTENQPYSIKTKAQNYFSLAVNNISHPTFTACDSDCGAGCGSSCDCAGPCQ